MGYEVGGNGAGGGGEGAPVRVLVVHLEVIHHCLPNDVENIKYILNTHYI